MKICASKLASQSYYEAFEEKLQNGSLQAKGLTHVISVEEEKSQKEGEPKQSSTQKGLQLDATLTIQTKKRFLSSKPDSPAVLAAGANAAAESKTVSGADGSYVR